MLAAESSEPSTSIHLRTLDGIRGAAAYTVVISHLEWEMHIVSPNGVGGAGVIGVMLFFALSGFLLSYLYLQKKPTMALMTHYVAARIARVYPLYFVVVTVSAVISSVFAPEWFPFYFDFSVWFQHVALISGQSVFWTIPPEFHFYVSFLIFWWASSYLKHQEALCLLIFIGLTVYNLFVDPTSNNTFATSAHFFFGGVTVAIARRRVVINSAAFMNIGMLVGILLYISSFPRVFFELFNSYHTFFDSSFTLFAILTLLYFAQFNSWISQTIFGNRIIVYLGKISFSVYLLHLPILLLISSGLPTSTTNLQLIFVVAGYLLLTTFISALTFHFFEKPMRQRIMALVER